MLRALARREVRDGRRDATRDDDDVDARRRREATATRRREGTPRRA
jgi:hypothetical protein